MERGWRIVDHHGRRHALDREADGRDGTARLELFDIIVRRRFEGDDLFGVGIGGQRLDRVDDPDIVFIDHVELLELVPARPPTVFKKFLNFA